MLARATRGLRRRALPEGFGRHVPQPGHPSCAIPASRRRSRNFTVLDPGDTEDLIDLLAAADAPTRDRIPAQAPSAPSSAWMVNKSARSKTCSAVLPALRRRARRLQELYEGFERSSARATCSPTTTCSWACARRSKRRGVAPEALRSSTATHGGRVPGHEQTQARIVRF